jgi:hypothetical protein
MVWSVDRIILELLGSASARIVGFLKSWDNGYTFAFGRFLMTFVSAALRVGLGVFRCCSVLRAVHTHYRCNCEF